MAPTVSIEAIAIVRPLKALALMFCILTSFFILLCLTSSAWLQTEGWRQGLFEHCIDPDASLPLPFETEDLPGCHPARNETYILVSAVMSIISLITAVVPCVTLGRGLSLTDSAQKAKFYRLSVLSLTVSLTCLLVALILYPVSFTKELSEGNRDQWEFGWAYGIGWGAAIFEFGAIILVLCDQEEEEVYYKERTIMHSETDSRA